MADLIPESPVTPALPVEHAHQDPPAPPVEPPPPAPPVDAAPSEPTEEERVAAKAAELLDLDGYLAEAPLPDARFASNQAQALARIHPNAQHTRAEWAERVNHYLTGRI